MVGHLQAAEIGDRDAFDVLHHEVGHAVLGFAAVHHLRDVGMAQAGEDFLFLAEALAQTAVRGEHQFDRDLLFEAPVDTVRAIHRAHAAGAQQIVEHEGADAPADLFAVPVARFAAAGEHRRGEFDDGLVERRLLRLRGQHAAHVGAQGFIRDALEEGLALHAFEVECGVEQVAQLAPALRIHRRGHDAMRLHRDRHRVDQEGARGGPVAAHGALGDAAHGRDVDEGDAREEMQFDQLREFGIEVFELAQGVVDGEQVFDPGAVLMQAVGELSARHADTVLKGAALAAGVEDHLAHGARQQRVEVVAVVQAARAVAGELEEGLVHQGARVHRAVVGVAPQRTARDALQFFVDERIQLGLRRGIALRHGAEQGRHCRSITHCAFAPETLVQLSRGSGGCASPGRVLSASRGFGVPPNEGRTSPAAETAMLAPESAVVTAVFSADDQARIRTTLVPVAADPAGFARAFYARLFEHSPGLRLLFPAAMEAQYGKLAHTLNVIVAGLEHSDRLLPTLRALGEAHRRYGAKGMHFLSFGEALIQTLADRNGPGFEGESRAAWQRLYAWVANQMQAAARGA